MKDLSLPWRLNARGLPLTSNNNAVEILLEDKPELWADVVRAVNSHAQLIEALEYITLRAKSSVEGAKPFGFWNDDLKIIKECEAALAAAKGE